MLKVVQAVAESAGILTPSVADAASAADTHRQAIIAAQGALEAAGDALQAAHDRNADDVQLKRLEAAQAAAKASLSRAERGYISAERRLAQATDADSAKARQLAIADRDAALTRRMKAATEVDRLAALMAAAAADYDTERGLLSECARLGVANSSVYLAGGWELARNALERAGALPSRWLGDRADQPGAAAIAERDAGAIVAGRAAHD